VAVIVEPEPALRAQLMQAMERFRVNVVATGDTRETLALLDRAPVGALVVDAQLPTTSGFDLARAVRQHPRGSGAAIVVITNVRWSPFQKAAALHQMGLLDLLVKPVDPVHVAELVVGALSSEPLPEGGRHQATLVGRSSPAEDKPKPRSRRRARISADTLVDEPREEDTDVVADSAPDTQVDNASRKSWDADLKPISSEINLADPASHTEKRQVERATRAAQAGPAELRGNLTRTPFPSLLHRLYQKRASGALFLLNDRIKKIVYFKEGHPTYIKSNRLSECLGKVLVRQGMISEGQCRESLRRMAETTRQQGTVLIEMGVISPHDLVVGLAVQLRTKLMDIFTWTRGEFLFRRETKVPSDVISLDVSNATLIADGVRQCWDEQRLDEALAPLMSRYLAPNADAEMRFQELSLEPEEQTLLDNIDGARTLRQLLADSPLPARKAKVVALVLILTEVVVTLEQPVEPEEAPLAADLSSPGEESVRERLAAELVSLRKRDAFGVLGVAARCSDRELQQAHTRAAREYHPDQFRHLSAETRRMAQEIFRLINEAYHQVATAEAREQYSEREEPEPAEADGNTGESALEAERFRKQAKRLMAKKKWAEARQLLASAVNLCPDAGDLRALLAWTTYRADPESAAMVRTAIRELRRAIELEPRQHEAYLFLGRIYAGMGKTILAEKQFEKALQCNPDCLEALDELKIQKERRPPRRYRF
jgi:DNA-binding response OmpR family regulator/tetratricopeptide (TPR) repeat protein